MTVLYMKANKLQDFTGIQTNNSTVH